VYIFSHIQVEERQFAEADLEICGGGDFNLCCNLFTPCGKCVIYPLRNLKVSRPPWQGDKCSDSYGLQNKRYLSTDLEIRAGVKKKRNFWFNG